MLSVASPELLHLVGFLTGAVLYGMLLAMVTRPQGRPDALAFATGLLGVVWNIGQIGAYAARAADVPAFAPWLEACSFTALGLLAAVVVHSVARLHGEEHRASHERWPGVVAAVAYGCAGLAGVLHLRAAASGAPLPSPAGLTLLTIGLGVLVVPLVRATRSETSSRRALWMAALAVFAVSALHLGRFHVTHESWPTELVGHHASILLAFAILYQDYRFALADLFLKQALTLIALVALVFGAFAALEPLLSHASGRLSPAATGAVLSLWTATALLFPAIRRLVSWFVDRVVLARSNYARLLERLIEETQRCDTVETVLARTCHLLAPALTSANAVWTSRPVLSPVDLRPFDVAIWTAEPPRFVLDVGPLAGGRRLLSDDLAMLERVGVVVARRIDALRLTEERYERMLREREMRTLATEAELRALRAQINPHFLFNALTTIGYLIESAPARALDTLLRLTTLLRSVLRSEGEFTTLGRELELIECYLAIERERFEDRLAVTIDVPEALQPLFIPSLTVQPLVENAVKHGIAGARAGGRVEVEARIESHAGESTLVIEVRNTGAPLRRRGGSGVGLSNVERRLRHYYDQGAGVTLRAADGVTVAELRLPAVDVDRARLAAAGGRMAS